HGRGCADRAVRRTLDPRVQRVGARRSEQHGEPAEAVAEILADEVAEEGAEGEVTAEVIEIEVHRERRDRAPPLAVPESSGLEPARAEPVALEESDVQREE